jgi:hypothetical protein
MDFASCIAEELAADTLLDDGWGGRAEGRLESAKEGEGSDDGWDLHLEVTLRVDSKNIASLLMSLEKVIYSAFINEIGMDLHLGILQKILPTWPEPFCCKPRSYS